MEVTEKIGSALRPNITLDTIGQESVFVQTEKYICPNCLMYLSKLLNIFGKIVEYICPNCQLYLWMEVTEKIGSDLRPNITLDTIGKESVFVQTAKYIFVQID